MGEEEKGNMKEEVDGLDEMRKEENEQSDISSIYKLFNLVCRQTQDQVIRYFEPELYHPHQKNLHPLWASSKNILKRSNVPQCPKCKQPRSFEMQIMPQIFDKIDQLTLVDWDTIAIYTCTNVGCLPDFD